MRNYYLAIILTGWMAGFSGVSSAGGTGAQEHRSVSYTIMR